MSERAQRRHKETLEKNIPTDFEELTKEIQARDEYDSTRKGFAPEASRRCDTDRYDR